MAIRNILNYNNEIIGQLELPDNTPEEVWQKRLEAFKVFPSTQSISDVTPRQIRQALILSGISLEQIETALDSLPEPTRSLAKIEWEYSIAFKRDRPLVIQVGQMLGWTSEQLDDLWKFANTL